MNNNKLNDDNYKKLSLENINYHMQCIRLMIKIYSENTMEMSLENYLNISCDTDYIREIIISGRFENGVINDALHNIVDKLKAELSLYTINDDTDQIFVSYDRTFFKERYKNWEYDNCKAIKHDLEQLRNLNKLDYDVDKNNVNVNDNDVDKNNVNVNKNNVNNIHTNHSLMMYGNHLNLVVP